MKRIRSRRVLLEAAIAAVATVALGFASIGSANNRLPDNGHWSMNNQTQAFVNIIDRTGPDWPIYASAINWDSAGRISVNYHADSCNGRAQCAAADASNFGVTCFQLSGATAESAGAGNHFTSVAMRFNNACKQNHGRAELQVVTCHEEGHALGLDHVPSSIHDTCMAEDPTLSQSNTGRAHDFDMLDNVIYNHND